MGRKIYLLRGFLGLIRRQPPFSFRSISATYAQFSEERRPTPVRGLAFRSLIQLAPVTFVDKY